MFIFSCLSPHAIHFIKLAMSLGKKSFVFIKTDSSKKSNESRLFKPFKFGNGSRMSGKNLVILEFKYLQNKKCWKQAVKSARIKKSYRTY